MPSTDVFNELYVKITLLRPKKTATGVCHAVYFRLCIDLIHITPRVTAEGFGGSHHLRYAECNLSKLGDDDASNKTGRIFEEHDLRKTIINVKKGKCWKQLYSLFPLCV